MPLFFYLAALPVWSDTCQNVIAYNLFLAQSDTLRLVSGFGSNDTIDFFKGNITHKSLFLLLLYTEEDMRGPSVYHVYDLKLDDVSTLPMITNANKTTPCCSIRKGGGECNSHITDLLVEC